MGRNSVTRTMVLSRKFGPRNIGPIMDQFSMELWSGDQYSMEFWSYSYKTVEERSGALYDDTNSSESENDLGKYDGEENIFIF